MIGSLNSPEFVIIVSWYFYGIDVGDCVYHSYQFSRERYSIGCRLYSSVLGWSDVHIWSNTELWHAVFDTTIASLLDFQKMHQHLSGLGSKLGWRMKPLSNKNPESIYHLRIISPANTWTNHEYAPIHTPENWPPEPPKMKVFMMTCPFQTATLR